MKSLYYRFRSIIRYLSYALKGGLLKVEVIQRSPGYLLKDKVCVVTGGARGLGAVLVKRLLSEGAEVIAIGSNQERLSTLLLNVNSTHLHTYLWDLNDLSHIEHHVEQVLNLAPQKKIDVWVNNAGYLTSDAAYMQNPSAVFDKTFSLNVKSLLFVSQAICEYYKKEMIPGKLVNISSENSVQASIHPYFLSKRAVNGITEALAKRYLQFGIVVNGIAPGYLPSGINNTDVAKNAYREASFSRRFVLPGEVAELLLFLVSGQALSIVGQTIFIDGGDTLR